MTDSPLERFDEDAPATVTHEPWEVPAAPPNPDWWKEYAPDEVALFDAIFDVPPLTAPQAQGDVIVLPWLDTTTPKIRAERVAATVEIDAAGCAVTADGSHVLLPNRLHDRAGVRYAYVNKGNTLGTLVVEDGYAARLAHDEHGDLLIGPGVYVLHQQRQWKPARPAPVVD